MGNRRSQNGLATTGWLSERRRGSFGGPAISVGEQHSNILQVVESNPILEDDRQPTAWHMRVGNPGDEFSEVDLHVLCLFTTA